MWNLYYYGYILFTLYIFNAVCMTNMSVNINSTLKEDPALYKPAVISNQQSELKLLRNCSLVPKFPEVRNLLSTLVSKNKLIKIKIEIIGEYGELNDTYKGSVYNLHQWVISTSLTGNSMLMLKEYFDAMSLMTLGHGVASATLILTQNPKNCLRDALVEEIETSLRIQFLTNFNAVDYELPDHTVICNAHVHVVDKSKGSIDHTCCSRTLDNLLECSVLEEGIWLKLLFVLIYVMKVLVGVFSSNFLPSLFATAKNTFHKYVFKTETGTVLKLNVKKITEEEKVNDGFVETIQDSLAHLRNLKLCLRNMIPGEVYTLNVKAVDISVKESELIAEGKASVSVMNFMWNFFVRCNLRFEIPSVTKCCNQNMFVYLPCPVPYPWYYFLGFVMRMLMGAVIISPWLLRVLFYYSYEEDVILHQKQVLQNRNLTYLYPGSMLTYLSPSHKAYVVMYIFTLTEILCYILLPTFVKLKLKRTVRACIRDMNNTPKLEACAFYASHMLWPLKRYGILGCLMMPFWILVLPFLLLLLFLEILPVVNLSIRLLVNTVYYTLMTLKRDIILRLKTPSNGRFKNWVKQKFDSILVIDYSCSNEKKLQIFLSISLVLSLITLWVVLFIVIDCVTFYVECAVYTLVGFILNPGDTMKYVSLIFLVSIYGVECFSGVHKKYAEYSKAINTEIQSMIGDRLTDEAEKPESKQTNVAFRVPNSNTSVVTERMHLEIGPEGYLQWRAPRLTMFLDKSDIPYIPKIFLYEMAKLQHCFSPGAVHLLYLKAIYDFSLILGFLLFVFITIFAFGQAHDISSGGKTLAALGSGFLPLVFRKFLFQSHNGTGIDKSNLKWKYMFLNAMQTFSTTWNFTDIRSTRVEKTESEAEAHASRQDEECNINVVPTDEISTHLIQNCTEQNIDLIVKTFLRQGKKTFTFYVPGNRTIHSENSDTAIPEDIAVTSV